MSNTANQIHELLNTMNPTEKSYVKKTFKTNEKNMSLLFDDLNKCDEFNKNTFLTRNKKRPYMKYLSQNCSYLLKSITKSLIDYNTENLTEINILARLSSISLLVKKGMISACLQKIEREIELAEKYQYYEYGYKLVKLKERFYKIYLLKEFCYSEHVIFSEKKKFFIQQLQLIDELELLSIAMFNIDLPVEEKLNLAKQKFKELNIDDKKELPAAAPLLAKTIFNFIQYKISELQGKPTLKYLKESLIDFDKKEFLKEIYFENYVLCISTYLSGIIANEQFELFFQEYEKYHVDLKGFSKWKTMNTSPVYHIIEYMVFIEACVKSNCTFKAIAKVKAFQQIIFKNKEKLMDSLVFDAISLNSIALFNTGYINETLDAIELLKKDKSIEVQYFYKMLQILCHYKLDNIMLVVSLSSSFANYLRKNNQSDKLKCFLQLKKCLLDNDCNDLHKLEFLPFLDFNTLIKKPIAVS